jgi:hypothetical protein
MTLVCRLKESHSVARWLAVPSVGLWWNYCFFQTWRRDFSARSQGQVAGLCTSAWTCSACLYNRFPVHTRWTARTRGHIQLGLQLASLRASGVRLANFYWNERFSDTICGGGWGGWRRKLNTHFTSNTFRPMSASFRKHWTKCLFPQYWNFGTKFYYIFRYRSLLSTQNFLPCL